MKLRENYSLTRKACYIAYITQSVAINFTPLLYVMFHNKYNITISKISMLITVTFLVQLLIDFLSAHFVDKIGYRKCVVAAHLFAVLGLVLLAVLPDMLPNAFAGLVTACLIYSVGSGLIEVIISPLVESCPSDNKEAQMSMLHSFYCWGTAGVILISTICFNIFGMGCWKVLSCIWALVPLVNMVLFCFVPITHETETKESIGMIRLCKRGVFWIFIILMICGGASEIAMSQWASAFAESGLNVSKTMGDMAGPFMFAVVMGMGRVIYAKLSENVDMIKYMCISAVLCIISYIKSGVNSRICEKIISMLFLIPYNDVTSKHRPVRI